MDYKNKENLNLLNPKKFQEPIVVDDFTKEFLFDCLNKMLIIRLSENKLAQNHMFHYFSQCVIYPQKPKPLYYLSR